MQMACIEAARNLAGMEGASTTEFGETPEPVRATGEAGQCEGQRWHSILLEWY